MKQVPVALRFFVSVVSDVIVPQATAMMVTLLLVTVVPFNPWLSMGVPFAVQFSLTTVSFDTVRL